jgi:hypothetical protein
MIVKLRRGIEPVAEVGLNRASERNLCRSFREHHLRNGDRAALKGESARDRYGVRRANDTCKW